MTEENKAPALHIPEHLQSNPKEHYADKAIRQAAQEIHEHKWTPDPGDEQQQVAENMGLALGLGNAGVGVGEKPSLGEFQDTHDLNAAISSHPRVLEALEKMQEEIREIKGHELVEKNAMLRELTEASDQKNRWDGQGRWMGAENEEMRYGTVLTPQQFYDRLGKVVGKGRLKLSDKVVFPADHQRSGLSGIYMRNPLYDGQAASTREQKRQEALAVADECKNRFELAKAFRRRGDASQADKILREIADMISHARDLYDSMMTREVAAEPEILRVATIQWPLSTEWMIMDFTEWGAVCKPKFYGWRTALLTMIRAGVIKEAQAHKAFPVPQGPAGQWYVEQIYNFHLEGAIQ